MGDGALRVGARARQDVAADKAPDLVERPSLVLLHPDAVPTRDAEDLGRLLDGWFRSPFWGAAGRATGPLRVAPTSDPQGAVPAHAHVRRLAAEISRGGAVGGASAPPFVDRSVLGLLPPAIDPGELAGTHALTVGDHRGRSMVVPGLAGLLALLLLRRLDVRVGEGLVRALVAPAAPGGDVVPWADAAPAPAHLLLPTMAGAALRAGVDAASTPLLVPPALYMPVVGHLMGTPVDVVAGRVGLLTWMTGEAPRWDPELVLHRTPLRGRLLGLAALRATLIPAVSLASRLPRRMTSRSVRWPLALLMGSLESLPAPALVGSAERRLLRVP